MRDNDIIHPKDGQAMEEKWEDITENIYREADRHSGPKKEHYGAELVAASVNLLGAGVRELTKDSVIMRATGTYFTDTGYRQIGGWLCFDDAPDCLMYINCMWLGYIKECQAESDNVTKELIDVLERLMQIAIKEGSIDNDALISLVITGVSCLADSAFLGPPTAINDWSVNSLVFTHDLGKNGKLKHKDLLKLSKADEIDADNPEHLRLLEKWLVAEALGHFNCDRTDLS